MRRLPQELETKTGPDGNIRPGFCFRVFSLLTLADFLGDKFRGARAVLEEQAAERNYIAIGQRIYARNSVEVGFAGSLDVDRGDARIGK